MEAQLTFTKGKNLGARPTFRTYRFTAVEKKEPLNNLPMSFRENVYINNEIK